MAGHEDNYDGGDYVAECTLYLHPYVMNCSLDVFNLVIKVTSHKPPSIERAPVRAKKMKNDPKSP